MNTREIRVRIELDRELYEELMSVMMEARDYEGWYIMQYAEHRENCERVGVFTLRDGGRSPMLDSR